MIIQKADEGGPPFETGQATIRISFADAIRDQAAAISSVCAADVELYITEQIEALSAAGRHDQLHLIDSAMRITAETFAVEPAIAVTVAVTGSGIAVEAYQSEANTLDDPETERLFYAAMAATATAATRAGATLMISPGNGAIWSLDIPNDMQPAGTTDD